jgi:hypothetical protein
MLERTKMLKTKIPVSKLEDCFKPLAALVIDQLDYIISELNNLSRSPKYQVKSNLPFKINQFQKIVSILDYLENNIIACLNRCTKDDINLTNFVGKICKEINYPLLSPIATSLSQSYYGINTQFNLLKTPLLESEFLLHMPDIYHELAHPLISKKDYPTILPLQNKLGKFNLITEGYFNEQIKEFKRNNGIELANQVEVFAQSWIESWSVELFCDLFAVYTLGPAYAWAHLHLCVKWCADPFETTDKISSHPADDARMRAILIALNLLGFKTESEKINEYWVKFLDVSYGVRNTNYKMAYPDEILEHCAIMALEGTKEINCVVVNESSNGKIYKLLNTAWEKFTADPSHYLEWEKSQRII